MSQDREHLSEGFWEVTELYMGIKAEDSIKNCRMGEGRLTYSKTSKIIKDEQQSNERCVQ